MRSILTRNTFYGTRYLSHCCALAYFAVKRSFCNIEKLRWSTRVRMLPHFVSSHVIGHVRISKIRSGWFPIGGPLTPTFFCCIVTEINVTKLTRLKLIVRTMWWYHSTKAAKIIYWSPCLQWSSQSLPVCLLQASLNWNSSTVYPWSSHQCHWSTEVVLSCLLYTSPSPRD